MITPRRTRLVRAADLHAFRRVIPIVSPPHEDTLVVVPNRAAARLLGRAIGAGRFVTRDELYAELHARLPAAPRMLTPFERQAIADAAAGDASKAVPDLTFRVRPGLVAEMVRFYDLLKRQLQTVERFAELAAEALGSDETGDRGAARLLRQTRFMAHAFAGYERRVAATGGCDEHTLRSRLAEAPALSHPVRHLVVTVADWIADPDGLFVADFDLLTRLAGLETVDLVCTEATLASGFHQRIHEWLPGIEEVEGANVAGARPPVRPRLVVPDTSAERPWFVRRDREEELVAVVTRYGGPVGGVLEEGGPEGPHYDRHADDCGPHTADLGRGADLQVRPDRPGRSADLQVRPDRPGRSADLEVRLADGRRRVGVVYKRPLPYLYLAPAVFGTAGMAWDTADALPLAAEPTAAAVDLVLDAVDADFSRESLVALLRSPHLRFDDAPVSPLAISALDRGLSELRYLGGLDRLRDVAGGWGENAGREAAAAALGAAERLAPLGEPAAASRTVKRLASLLAALWTPLDEADPFAAREQRARRVVERILEGLGAAQEAHHDPQWTHADLAAAVRRAIEQATFDAAVDRRGDVSLVDDQAARFGDFDDLFVVGLIESEWPEPGVRNIFYPAALLKALGWPPESDRRAAADARFLDLLASASRSVTLSTITLDNEALVTRSTMLDEVGRARLSSVADAPGGAGRAFADEPPAPEDGRDDDAAAWLRLRTSRPAAELPAFHGAAGPGAARPRAGRPWSVSAVETYLECPFKFFARHVLALDEEPEDEEVMDPRRQGRFVHAVFEDFFRTWQESGRKGITAGNIGEARALFESVVERQLRRAGLSEAEAGLERTRLLGSPAASGLGEAVFRMEAERPAAVVERLLEQPIGGDLEIETAAGPRAVALAGKADRIDLLEDGTFRLIDYKLGWPPDRTRALQLPLYGLFAERRLQQHRGRRFVLGEAVYLAFKGPKRVVPLFSSPAQRAEVLGRAQERLGGALDAIGRGEFPPAPDDVYRCETCSFSAVCRRDYVNP